MLLFVEINIYVDGLRFVHKFANQFRAPELVHGPHKARIFLKLHIAGSIVNWLITTVSY